MKKALVCLLTVVLMLTMAIPAYAAPSPEAPPTNENTTSPIPDIVTVEIEKTDGTTATIHVQLVPVDEAKELTEEEQEIFLEAQKTLAEARPEGMKALYFDYVKIEVDGELPESMEDVVSVTVTLNIQGVEKVVVKQFVEKDADKNGVSDTIPGVNSDIQRAWIERESSINQDGTITTFGVTEGPIAIFGA